MASNITQALKDLYREVIGEEPPEEKIENAKRDAVFSKLDAVPPVDGAKPDQKKAEDLTRSSTLSPVAP